MNRTKNAALAAIALVAAVAGTAARGDEPRTPRVGPIPALAPLGPLAGTFQGEGRSPMGAYRETITAAWTLGGTALELRSRCTAGDMVVFEDLRVFTHDAARGRLRARQFAFGGVATYDVEVREGAIVMREVEKEGLDRPEWRYEIRAAKDGAIAYVVTSPGPDGAPRPYVEGKLARTTREGE